MSSKEITTTKLLSSLAEEANINMQINKHILEKIQIYENQINDIKQLLKKEKEKDKENNKNNDKNNNTFIYEYINILKKLKNSLNQDIQKISEKNNKYKEKLFENSTIEQSLEKEQLDNFIIKYTLEKLNDDIFRYNKSIKASKKDYGIFFEPKRDTDINSKTGDYIIYNLSVDSQRSMLLENRNFSKCVNKNMGYQRKIKKKKKKIEKLKYYIEMFKRMINKIPLLKKFDSSTNIFEDILNIQRQDIIETSNNVNKKFQEDDNNFQFNSKVSRNVYQKKIIKKKDNENSDNDDEDNIKIKKYHNKTISVIDINNNQLSLINDHQENEEESEKESQNEKNNINVHKNNLSTSVIYNNNSKNKNKKKLQLLSLDELFDISNYEGKKEEIIDEELHSNDDTKFEKKVIPQKKIINDYLKQIKSDVPSLNLSLIEFNKEKAMNEADMYSLQRRNFEVNDIDCLINNMKKKIKKIRKKTRINQKKYLAMRDFINETKNNYKILRPLKIKSTAEGANIDFKIQNLIGKSENNGSNKNILKGNENVIEEEVVGSEYSDEDKYEDEKEMVEYLKTNEINIIKDEDSGNEVDNNDYMKTQIDIKPDIGLNLGVNVKNNGKNKKYIKKKAKIKEEDEGKFNSK